MKSRIKDLDAAKEQIKPFLPQYLQENDINPEKNFSCLNPKHKDSKPSMTCKQVPDNAFCMGCGATVDIFQAAHYLEGKPIKGREFIEQNLMYLAERYSVQIKIEDLTPEEIYEMRTYEAYRLAATLISDPNFGDYSKASEEIKSRGWDPEKCAGWGIGTVNYDEYKAYMKASGFEPGFLSGIDLDRSQLFNNNNLLFTVYDDYGKPVGFSAKNLKHDKNDPNSRKYINSRGTGLECAIFKKGSRLYGFDIAKDAANPLFIFEGQADVITARHNGLLNCCCTLGTALTDHHINLLKRHGIFSVVLVFDGDQAGELAVQKAVDDKFAKEKDFRVKLCQMPDGEDPDSLIRDKGIGEFGRLKKWTAFEWRMMRFMDDSDDEDDMDDEKKREIAEKMARIIVSEESHIRQEEMTKQVAKATGYDQLTVLSEVKRLRNQKEEEVQTKKRNAIEALTYEVNRNPDSAELALVDALNTINEINRSIQDENTGSKVLNKFLNQKEEDESKTGEFAGFYMKPNGLGGIAARLDDDWRSDSLIFIGGGEQSGKCLHEDMQILLADGVYKKIKDVVEENTKHVLGMNSKNKIIPMEVSKWIDSGQLECFEVKTKNGISTKPSETHPYYTIEGWKKVKELKVGDKIAIARNYKCFNNLRSPISEEDTVLLSAFLSNGSITDSVGFLNTDEELIDYFKENIKNKWDGIEYIHEDNNVIYLKDTKHKQNDIRNWLESYNLFGLNAHEKFIPDDIFRCSSKRIAKFLGMFWACDGWVYHHPDLNKYEIGLSLCNYNMVKQIRSLLIRFGIKTKISSNIVNLEEKEFNRYTLSIKDIENIKKFYNNIRIPLKYKQNRIKSILDSHKNSIRSYNDNFPVELLDRIKEKTTEKGWSFNYLLKLIGEDKNKFSYDKSKDRFKEEPAWEPKLFQITERKLRLIGNLLGDQFLIDLADGDIYFDEIISIKEIGKHQCYDLEVPGDHNFIAEDTIVHNTTLCSQMAYEIASDPRNEAMCIYHSIDDAAKYPTYKWICNATNDTKLKLNYVSSPKYSANQYGDWIYEERDKGYKKITKLFQDERLVIIDSSDGQSITYAESIVKFYRDKYPKRNIVLFVDNFHKIPDYPNLIGAERTKRISNHVKNMTVSNRISIVATAEYKKLAPGEKPTNLAMAESRALQYDASAIIHLFNDLHHSSEEEAVLIHKDIDGQILPRIWCKFGKNKISGYEGREFLDLFGYAGQMKAVDLEMAMKEQKERIQFLKSNESYKY